MIYFTTNPSIPLEYVSSGTLKSENGFVHPKRNIDTFVFILVIKGTLYITEDGHPYEIAPNQFIILLPNVLHFGTKPSDGELLYYWTHFSIKDNAYKVYDNGKSMRSEMIQEGVSEKNIFGPSSDNMFVLSIVGALEPDMKVNILFNQLLDIAKRSNYYITWRNHYALTLLMLETSYESNHLRNREKQNVPPRVAEIMEWIRTHYEQKISAEKIGAKFDYNAVYLESLFKKHTGYTLVSYINRIRIDVAKNLLYDNHYRIVTIARCTGFNDEKYFIRVFKKITGMTPTQYRKAFYEKKINIQ